MNGVLCEFQSISSFSSFSDVHPSASKGIQRQNKAKLTLICYTIERYSSSFLLYSECRRDSSLLHSHKRGVGVPTGGFRTARKWDEIPAAAAQTRSRRFGPLHPFSFFFFSWRLSDRKRRRRRPGEKSTLSACARPLHWLNQQFQKEQQSLNAAVSQ